MSVKETLAAAKVSDAAVTKLDEQGMLDAELLAGSTAAELQQGCGITMGDALRVKKAYPSAAATAPLATTPTAPIVAIIATPVAKSDEEILKGVKDKNEAAIEEARKRWGASTVFVTANDNSLDVTATLEALKFFKKHGAQERFQNTEKKSVRTQSLDQLIKEEVDLNPLTRKVLVPGDEMYELTEDQRLLIAFAVVTAEIPFNADEDSTVDGVKRKTGRWVRMETDLAQARADETGHYTAAKKLIRCKAGEVPVGFGHGGLEKQATVAAAPVFNLAFLGGPGTEELVKALSHAFYNQSELNRLTHYEMETRLNHITGDGPLLTMVRNVVVWADSQSRLRELVEAASGVNPGNAYLKAFREKHGIKPKVK